MTSAFHLEVVRLFGASEISLLHDYAVGRVAESIAHLTQGDKVAALNIINWSLVVDACVEPPTTTHVWLPYHLRTVDVTSQVEQVVPYIYQFVLPESRRAHARHFSHSGPPVWEVAPPTLSRCLLELRHMYGVSFPLHWQPVLE